MLDVNTPLACFVDALDIVASYVDKVHGGGVKQPELQRLLAAAQSSENGFDVVVVSSLSRLSRSAEDLHVIVSLLRDLGVEVVSVSEPHTPSAQATVYSRVTEEAQE